MHLKLQEDAISCWKSTEEIEEHIALHESQLSFEDLYRDLVHRVKKLYDEKSVLIIAQEDDFQIEERMFINEVDIKEVNA